jgi:DNA-directed RNA polymerase sigma subunit (sigma70/sigma32)
MNRDRDAEGGPEPMTYVEIAAVMGLTPYQVRELEERALRKLRHNRRVLELAKLEGLR